MWWKYMICAGKAAKVQHVQGNKESEKGSQSVHHHCALTWQALSHDSDTGNLQACHWCGTGNKKYEASINAGLAVWRLPIAEAWSVTVRLV